MRKIIHWDNLSYEQLKFGFLFNHLQDDKDEADHAGPAPRIKGRREIKEQEKIKRHEARLITEERILVRVPMVLKWWPLVHWVLFFSQNWW